MKPFILFVFSPLLLVCCNIDNEEGYNGNNFGIYLSKDSVIRTDINISTLEVENEPFIEYDDIIWYDSSEHIMRVSISIDSIFTYKDNMDYRGFIAYLDTVKLFYGIFYSPIHSVGNPNIVITLPCDNIPISNRLKIYEGYPNSDYYKSYKSVNEPRFIKMLKIGNKLR
jgi:hypothetical protein